MGEFADWIGRSEEYHDTASRDVADRLDALFDRPANPQRSALPALAHWAHFLPNPRRSEIGEDGHPRRGGFLPPIALPRRMWAGSRIQFVAPIAIGAALHRTSRIIDIRHRSGRSGEMVFVTLEHEVRADDTPALIEQQDIVYRAAPKPGTAKASPAVTPPAPAAVEHQCQLGPADLFRFSALTANGHRIHYDRPYAVDVEGYDGLVVHGPYAAMMLLDLFEQWRPGATVEHFTFRGQQPLYESEPFTIALADTETGADLWIASAKRGVTMQASITVSR